MVRLGAIPWWVTAAEMTKMAVGKLRLVSCSAPWVACLWIGGCVQPVGTVPDPDAGDERLAVFVDPDGDFSTMDVYDIDEEIVRFDPERKTLIWAADNLEFDDWDVEGNLLGSQGAFQVRFGTIDGERRAYFTETGPETICDISVNNERLTISPTSVTVPEHTGM